MREARDAIAADPYEPLAAAAVDRALEALREQSAAEAAWRHAADEHAAGRGPPPDPQMQKQVAYIDARLATFDAELQLYQPGMTRAAMEDRKRERKAASQRAAAAAAAAATADGADAEPGPRAVPRLVMRTAFLDDAVLVAAGGGAASAGRLLSTPRAADALRPLADHVRAHACAPGAPPVHRLQVVLLGAGMDARPWRLPLPPGRVRWIEVDRADVIAAKKRALAAAGAEVPGAAAASEAPAADAPASPPPPLVAPPSRPPTAAPAPPLASARSMRRQSSAAAASAAIAAVALHEEQEQGDRAAAAAAAAPPPAGPPPFAFPLRASAWHGVAADLTSPGWTAALERDAGFDRSVPTLWVAEGLLYYLDPPAVPAMLREAARASAPGSALVATVITDATLEAMRAGKEGVGGGKDGGGGAGAGAGAAAGPKDEDGGAAAAAAAPVAPGLTSKFVWGAPAADVDGYFSASGWSTLQRPTWSRAAEAYGWRAESRAGSRVPAEAQVQFLVAAVSSDGA